MKKTLVIGLTGSIGMGKSTVAKMFAARRIPVFCADACVHDVLRSENPVRNKIIRRHPDLVQRGRIDRRRLGALFFSDALAREWIEKDIHAAVFRAARAFIRENRKARTPMILLDIPLLFETGFDAQVDYVLCVAATRKDQKARVLSRPGMTPRRFAAIIKSQMPIAEKKKRANCVIHTSCSKDETRRAVRQFVDYAKKEMIAHA